MPNQSNVQIAPAAGKPGILVPGMGAVTAGLQAIEPGLAKPFGTLPQPGAVRPGKLTVGRRPAIRDFVPLASLACAAKT